jgi:hypothetical protein
MRLARSVSDAQNQHSVDNPVPASPTLAKLLAASAGNAAASSSSDTSNGDVFAIPTSRGAMAAPAAGRTTTGLGAVAGRTFKRAGSAVTSRHLFKAKQVPMTRKGAQQPVKPASVSSVRATTAKRKPQSPKRMPFYFIFYWIRLIPAPASPHTLI